MSKVMMEVEISVAANTTTDNAFTGQRFERMPADGYLTLMSTGSAAGLREELNIGGRSISGRMPVNTNNRSPIVPDDMRIERVWSREGELIQLSVTNTTAGALTYRARATLES